MKPWCQKPPPQALTNQISSFTSRTSTHFFFFWPFTMFIKMEDPHRGIFWGAHWFWISSCWKDDYTLRFLVCFQINRGYVAVATTTLPEVGPRLTPHCLEQWSNPEGYKSKFIVEYLGHQGKRAGQPQLIFNFYTTEA